ncbi:pyridoxamine 5'-phosphate oxidase family protein [Lipingzhangella sp. LS1_29]|uniref:Pyridoxamine 5'-phosphate oxidase family protein n=1 Tax=Lipingzhangella rawalii TaxID=2055835 RepID=A0ABU2HCS0_9ACTN|nr:pyridoxamine 5'-phosphate oxidase family protein [Lipingzhangella rawalii]MDS1272600.1 pyridoxamine 5'-phosphate oxidase family protein [Lipingzhangella rawalii]
MNSDNKAPSAIVGWGEVSRQVARRRAELGLSVVELAQRAGLSPGYVTHLEQYPTDLGAHVVARLARALETSSTVLLGVDAELLPWYARSDTGVPGVETLTSTQCMHLLRPGGVGRVAFLCEPQAAPLVFPVNFAVVDEDIVFRTAPRGIIARHADGLASFEVDQIDEARSAGWSVLLMGRIQRVWHVRDLEKLATVSMRSWAGEERRAWMRIIPDEVSGRRVVPGVSP